MLSYCTYRAPWGEMLLCANERALVGVFTNDECETLRSAEARGVVCASERNAHEVLRKATTELDEYFAGSRTTFDIPLDFLGFSRASNSRPTPTPFMLDVWKALLDIPYGETRSYAELAAMINRPKAARAVGNALNKNPLMIFGPCHRIVGIANPWGFACGPDVKRALLSLEGAI